MRFTHRTQGTSVGGAWCVSRTLLTEPRPLTPDPLMYRNLRQCVADLEATKQLVRIDAPVDANLELAEIQRRVFRAAGPALLFANVVGCRFPMLGNLFGTIERRDTCFAIRSTGSSGWWRCKSIRPT